MNLIRAKKGAAQTDRSLYLIMYEYLFTPQQQPGQRLDDAEYQLLTELV